MNRNWLLYLEYLPSAQSENTLSSSLRQEQIRRKCEKKVCTLESRGGRPVPSTLVKYGAGCSYFCMALKWWGYYCCRNFLTTKWFQ